MINLMPCDDSSSQYDECFLSRDQKISKNYQSKLLKMEEENDFENFEDNSIDPFNSSESEIDDSDSDTEFLADRMVAFLYYLEVLYVLMHCIER